MYIGQEFQGNKYGDAVRYIGSVEIKSFENLKAEGWSVYVLDSLELFGKYSKLARGWFFNEQECGVLGKTVDVYQHILHDDYEGSVTEYDDFEFVIQGEEWSEDLPHSKAIAIVDCDEDDYEFFNYLIKNRLTLSI